MLANELGGRKSRIFEITLSSYPSFDFAASKLSGLIAGLQSSSGLNAPASTVSASKGVS
jgi:hypothetical protein